MMDEEAMFQLKQNTPDAAILDINLDCETDGIEIAEYINKYSRIFLFYILHRMPIKIHLNGPRKQNRGVIL